ncbi:hypothetical protein HGRIS_009360 [Hohenbuehelia grisea]|uniref:Calcium activated cation channel n=1 Tax=Hohenbuehelia grisea TaxID=104357 RepID=A0ABR3J186_9AGAR
MPGFSNGEDGFQPDTNSLLSLKSVVPSPDTMTKLVKRLRALTLTLLPLEVDPESINDPTSRVITPEVIAAYTAAAGDFVEALPYCLLRAHAQFMWDANHNPADYGENHGRAIACEVLARRVVHRAAPDRLYSIMSTRYRHRQIDGDDSDMCSALELAIDSRCSIFLSSSEAQDVVNALWKGDLIQKNNAHHDIDYVEYESTREPTFWSHLDPDRLSVPRYQNIFRVVVWLFFLVAYSQAVREPLERLDEHHQSLDEWEIILYVLALSFCIEDVHKVWSIMTSSAKILTMLKVYKLLRFVTWRAFTFWNVVAILTDALLLTGFIFRVIGLSSTGDEVRNMRLKSFQVLSYVSPFIWMKLVTVFDGYKYIGTMQICIARMLQESGIFFALLSVLGIGFAQGLYALDAADGQIESTMDVINVLIQALLQAPDYEKFASSPAGMGLYYLWNLVTAVVLLNVLISLFSSAYSDIVDDAEAQYLAFFASKTIGMIRAPDSFVYPAPFNLIEVFFIAPFELFRLNADAYAKLNRYVMSVIFCVPLTVIALYESTLNSTKQPWLDSWMRGDNEGGDDLPVNRDPEVGDEEDGLQISKVPFTELIKVFPNVTQSSEATIIAQINQVKEQLAALTKKIEESR